MDEPISSYIAAIFTTVICFGMLRPCTNHLEASDVSEPVTVVDTIRTDKPILPNNRIVVKETLWNLAIVEIDSVEYLSNSKGGLIPLQKR